MCIIKYVYNGPSRYRSSTYIVRHIIVRIVLHIVAYVAGAVRDVNIGRMIDPECKGMLVAIRGESECTLASPRVKIVFEDEDLALLSFD